MDFQRLSCQLKGHEPYPYEIKKPDNFDEMKKLAEKLSSHFPFVRVDLYDSHGKIYFSELTFLPTGGYMRIQPPEILKEWGNWLILPET